MFLRTLNDQKRRKMEEKMEGERLRWTGVKKRKEKRGVSLEEEES